MTAMSDEYKKLFPYKLFFWTLLEPDDYANDTHWTDGDEKPTWLQSRLTLKSKLGIPEPTYRHALMIRGEPKSGYFSANIDYGGVSKYGYDGVYTWSIAQPLGYFAHEFSTEFGYPLGEDPWGTYKAIKSKHLGMPEYSGLWHNTCNFAHPQSRAWTKVRSLPDNVAWPGDTYKNSPRDDQTAYGANLPWTTPPDEIKQAFFSAFTPGVKIGIQWPIARAPKLSSRAWPRPIDSYSNGDWKIPRPDVADKYTISSLKEQFNKNLSTTKRADLYIDFKVLKSAVGLVGKIETSDEYQKSLKTK
jgi:hypothetical protein